MPLENVTIGRVCLHEVHRRPEEGPQLVPTFGTGLLELDQEAESAFRSRVIAAFKSTAQCMEVDIREFGLGSALVTGVELIKLRDTQFVNHSRLFAEALATAQISRQIPGGLMVVFDGTLGNPATPFFGLMKAELHEGFIKTANLQARFVNDLFLSPKTKLYKIGIFISDGVDPRPDLPEGWRAVVYDSAMSAAHRDAAATYFYSNFLGLNIPENAARQVKKFFEETKAFIKAQDIPEKDKVDLYNGLYAYLKLDRGNTIQTSRFAKTYMGDDLGDDYIAHMKKRKFPAGAIAKDISELAGVLRWRKFKFPRAITLSGPPDAIRDLVAVDSVNGDDGQSWTRITIRAQLQSQE
ncbi:nucleoid-associated protein [Novosphingobium sp.]|uniref:nucleoid-associated protein n=1 Tax=Novosphingobium sp. TaxID=1874826 RepID=UPI002FD98BC1